MSDEQQPTTPEDPGQDEGRKAAGRLLGRITKETTVSIALVLSVCSASYKAGQMAHRIDTIEADSGRTSQVLSQLQKLTELMDRRLTVLEDRTFNPR